MQERATESHGELIRVGARHDPPRELLIVGEAPNRGTGTRVLSSLDRRLWMLAWVPRINLLDHYPGPSRKGSNFPLAPAKRRAEELLEVIPEAEFLLAGSRVARAFGMRSFDYDYLEPFEFRGRCFAVIPHPSGIVRWWNDPRNRRAAEVFAEEVAGAAGLDCGASVWSPA